MSNHSITTLLHRAAEVLAAHSDSPRLDAELLLCQCLGCSRTWLVTWPEHVPEPDQQECFQAAITRRQRGEPVAHILGQREFWSLPLQVTPNTLIPRPETELLVERALEHIPEHTECHILDLGTGSGAIALAIASERPLATLTATDRSTEALEVARANARQGCPITTMK